MDLTNQEKVRLERLLFDSFHQIYSDKSDCWEIISISKKLGLRQGFVQELESCYDLEFKLSC